MMLPINLSDSRLDDLSSAFGCSKGTLPFTYLGLPLSHTKPMVVDFWPLVSKCESRLSVIFNFLSDAGRLQMTNVVLAALPTFPMCTYMLPKTVIKQIDKFHKHCLWRGSDVNNKKPPKALWTLVCDSKENGGLGVINLRVQNESLLLKHLHKIYNHVDTPWVELLWTNYDSVNRLPSLQGPQKGLFWWRDALKLQQQFKGIASVTLQSGATYFLWHDLWSNHVWSQSCLELFSFSKTPNLIVQAAA